MAIKMSPKEVADAFVKQYYLILDKCPENAFKFYQEASLLSWPGPDGMDTVTTFDGINEKIMSSDKKISTVEICTVDAQESQDEGVIVAVTGTLAAKDNDITKYFTQTFFLAKQEKGFYVLNDILRVFEIPLMASVTTTTDADNDQPEQTSADAKAEVQNKKVKDVTGDAGANVAVLTSYVDSPKKRSSATTTSSDEKAEGPVSAWVKPVNLKISYASVVARDTPVSPPKSSGVTPNDSKQQKTTLLATFAAKLVSPTHVASKGLAGSPKTKPRSPKVGSGAHSASANVETKGIYIGRLPYDITKQRIVEVVKQFGPVKRNPDNVQIMRHEDGFCCGFVEFESADSAHRAVEARHVSFGDKEESYITYKRSNKGTNGGRQSPTRAGVQSTNLKVRENETTSKARFHNDGQTRGRRWSNAREASH